MEQVTLTRRVRSYTRDFTDSIFRDQDIYDFINEGINRAKQVIRELRGMKTLSTRTQKVTHLPPEYQEILALYAASRCFTQDERHYQASNLMNEFEFKLANLKEDIINGEIVILDGSGNVVDSIYQEDYVRDNYFTKRRGSGQFNYVDEDD